MRLDVRVHDAERERERRPGESETSGVLFAENKRKSWMNSEFSRVRAVLAKPGRERDPERASERAGGRASSVREGEREGGRES